MSDPGALILIRHAEPVVNPGQPAAQWSLTPAGMEASRILAVRLRALAPMRVVTSHERKARATADVIGETLSIPVIEMPGFEEQGDNRVPFFIDTEAFDRAVQRHFLVPDEVVLGQESANQAAERFAQALSRARATCPGGTLACVSHGRVLCAFLARYFGVVAYSRWKRLGMPDAIVVDQQGRLLESWSGSL